MVALIALLALVAPLAAAAEGYGIEGMIGEDWKGMWGFQKRGFAECWLAGKRHQAQRTLSELNQLQQEMPEGPAKARLKGMQIELKTLLGCRLTPAQLEEGVNRFYDQPANKNVRLGDALTSVVLSACGGARHH
jgi:hypothetical protein